ncbi:MAG: NAD(P)-binding domain-containing protein [Rhodospirillales bacterium]|nr:NAD(P)-binding domain-containing protein [Rhodospirillales bacterium]
MPSMFEWAQHYYRWLHGQWPAGVVEKLPALGENGATNLAGVRIVGDLTGIPLLKFAADTGARAVQAILAEPGFLPGGGGPDVLDLAIVGGGVSGYAAAAEARKAGLRFALFEAQGPFATIADFPKGKPIYTYPTQMTPEGEIRFTATVKEDLFDELQAQTAGIEATILRVERIERQGGLLQLIAGTQRIRAERVIVAIGRSGHYRKLGVPGEDSDKVYNRLHDPRDFADRDVLVVGGGDSALEAAIALARAGAHVTLSYRRAGFARAKAENVEAIKRLGGSVRLLLGSTLTRIDPEKVQLANAAGNELSLVNDVVFAMTGREAPLDFFRRSGLAIAGEWGWRGWAGLMLMLAFSVWLFHWKKFGFSIGGELFPAVNLPWLNPALWVEGARDVLGVAAGDPTSLLYTLLSSARDPNFWYALAYCTLVVVFGIRRVRRRRTQYVAWQTLTLVAIQCVPLFVLPQILLPWMGRNGFFHDGAVLQPFADVFFERYDTLGEERAYWRAYGFVLAWPLFVYNWFTQQPLWGWLAVGSIQTFVVIPFLVRAYGKGAYCGWICSCGALAETLGDVHRHKMPHGPGVNRWNMVGQTFLVLATLILVLRILSWVLPESGFATAYDALVAGVPVLNYEYFVDLLFAGVLGIAFYFHFSGRVWCRFACPLAALMHIYARFSRFRIFAEKKKCISCNVCTSVCHQGIDVMNFANKGLDMIDPECVRCSACVHACPTGVLTFGSIGKDGQPVYDRLAARSAPTSPGE